MLFYYWHPESGSLWKQDHRILESETDGLVEEIDFEFYSQLEKQLKGNSTMALNDFDARAVPPQQAMDKHPCGMFDFQITNTYLAPSKDNKYLMLMVELTSPVGRIMRNYIVDGPADADSQKTIEIANKQISALCHAVNVFRLTYPKDQNGSPIFDQAARELRGGRGRMEVAFQKGQEPTAENPAGGYVEVRKVFDAAGNEPGKGGSAPQPQQAQPAQQQAPQGQPMQQQPNGSWGGGQPQQPANPAPQAWGGGGQQQPQQQPVQQQPGGWSPQGSGQAPSPNPPWGSK